jgi:hypothetical protein
MPEELCPVDSRVAVDELRHRDYDRAQLLLFAGVREHGKTFALKRYIDSGEPRVLAFDPFEDFTSLSWPSSGDPEDLSGALSDLEWWKTSCRRRVRPPIGAAMAGEGGSREWAELAFADLIEGREGSPALRRCLLVLDEITLWTGPREGQALQTLVLQGRRLKLRMAIACQRIALVPGVLLSECTDLIIFKTTRPRDLEVLDEWGNSRRGRVGRAEGVAELAATMEIGECVAVRL